MPRNLNRSDNILYLFKPPILCYTHIRSRANRLSASSAEVLNSCLQGFLWGIITPLQR
ncbi:MAG: hypothetical protein LC116_07955 [Bacteroidetes bacterium]|nr:hypothetical protein [Bacteroidota bacterium]MCZ2133098.1 hypothetical protein [Bacteroidota bacterium]